MVRRGEPQKNIKDTSPRGNHSRRWKGAFWEKKTNKEIHKGFYETPFLKELARGKASEQRKDRTLKKVQSPEPVGGGVHRFCPRPETGGGKRTCRRTEKNYSRSPLPKRHLPPERGTRPLRKKDGAAFLEAFVSRSVSEKKVREKGGSSTAGCTAQSSSGRKKNRKKKRGGKKDQTRRRENHPP